LSQRFCRETVVPCLPNESDFECHVHAGWSNQCTLPHPVRHSLIQTFGEDRIVSSDQTHGSSVSRFNTGRLLVVGIFEMSRVSISLSSLLELKDAIRKRSIPPYIRT
ncbi:hypothetical protein TNCV_3514901, partial [Trichonephila clavipes]